MSYRPYPGQYQQPVPQQPQYQPQYPPQYPPQYYRPPKPRRPKSGSAFVGMIFAIVVVILLGIALYMPWLGMKGNLKTTVLAQDYTIDITDEENLYEAKGTAKARLGATDIPTQTTTEKHENDVKTVYDVTLYLTIISLVLWIVAIISAILVGIGVLRPGIGAILLVIGLVFTIITPIYFALALPSAQQKDLEESMTTATGCGTGDTLTMQGIEIKAIYGSCSGNINYTNGTTGQSTLFNTNLSWWPTYSWYLSLVALVMGAVALGLVVKRPRAGAPYPQYRPAPVQPQYQQYPQPPPYYPPPR